MVLKPGDKVVYLPSNRDRRFVVLELISPHPNRPQCWHTNSNSTGFIREEDIVKLPKVLVNSTIKVNQDLLPKLFLTTIAKKLFESTECLNDLCLRSDTCPFKNTYSPKVGDTVFHRAQSISYSSLQTFKLKSLSAYPILGPGACTMENGSMYYLSNLVRVPDRLLAYIRYVSAESLPAFPGIRWKHILEFLGSDNKADICSSCGDVTNC